MNADPLTTPEIAWPKVPPKIFLTEGLLPFANAKEFVFFRDKKYFPLLRIECATVNLSFVLTEPKWVPVEYQPVFSTADLTELGLRQEDEYVVLLIVNLNRGLEEATVNLTGPLLINLKTGAAKQVVPLNYANYSCRHKLLKEK